MLQDVSLRQSDVIGGVVLLLMMMMPPPPPLLLRYAVASGTRRHQVGDTLGVVYDQGSGLPCVEVIHRVRPRVSMKGSARKLVGRVTKAPALGGRRERCDGACVYVHV